MRLRIKAELELLHDVYGEVKHVEQGGEDWFNLPAYVIPKNWLLACAPVEVVPVSFLIKADYPSTAPYGFLVPASMTFNGNVPSNTGAPPKPVPFSGDWLHVSWTVENWLATANARKGSNLVAWCRSFAVRLREGV